jgi:hypothetical protein
VPTVARLSLAGALCRTLATTNSIESALSVTQRVTPWGDGDMRRRWCVAGLLRAEDEFRRTKGHGATPVLIKDLEVMTRGQPIGSVGAWRENLRRLRDAFQLPTGQPSRQGIYS